MEFFPALCQCVCADCIAVPASRGTVDGRGRPPVALPEWDAADGNRLGDSPLSELLTPRATAGARVLRGSSLAMGCRILMARCGSRRVLSRGCC